MSAMFDGEDLVKLEQGTTWDGSLFDAGRNGERELRPLGASAAPTRGPSPAPSGIEAPKDKAGEDDELERALQASRHDAKTQSSGFVQETGKVNADGTEQNFGLATNKEYEERHWGMTLYSSTEAVPDAPIEARTQSLEDPLTTPRFLKHLPDGDYTPNLLTICHAIPKARAALLADTFEVFTREDYGSDDDWWRGSPIRVPRVVSLDDNEAIDPVAEQYEDFIAELQRLMAFLDDSRRVYASTRGLAETDILKNSTLDAVESCTLVELVMNTWTQAIKSRASPEQAEQVTGLFTTVIGTTAPEGLRQPNLTLADMTVDCNDDVSDELRPELPELLDDLLWDTDPQGTSNDDNYVERLADVVVMRLRQTNKEATHLNVKVPPYLDLGKYLKENVAATQAIRQQMIQGKKRIAKIVEIEKKLRVWHSSKDNTEIDASQLLKYTLGHFSGQNRRDADQADKTNNASLAADLPAHYPDVTQRLQAVIKSIDAKLENLVQEREKTRKAVSELSKASPESSQTDVQQHRYVLRGIATKPNITYVLRQKPQLKLDAEADESNEPMANASDDADSTPSGMQWWRLDYEVSGSNVQIHRTPAEDYDVIRAVELEHNSALLVYANEDANDADTWELYSALPKGLQNFIDQDNKKFEEEDVEKSERPPEPPPYESGGVHWGAIPRTERRGSNSSMDVHRDEIVDDGRHPSFDGFVDNNHSVSLGFESRVARQSSMDPPVAEIHLPQQKEEEADLLGGDVEMVERGHTPLIPQQRSFSQENKVDAEMGGMETQDMGVGGSVSHVEDREERKGG